jgi:hypothetical protein
MLALLRAYSVDADAVLGGRRLAEPLQRVRDSWVAVLFKPVGAATLMQALAD